MRIFRSCCDDVPVDHSTQTVSQLNCFFGSPPMVKTGNVWQQKSICAIESHHNWNAMTFYVVQIDSRLILGTKASCNADCGRRIENAVKFRRTMDRNICIMWKLCEKSRIVRSVQCKLKHSLVRSNSMLCYLWSTFSSFFEFILLIRKCLSHIWAIANWFDQHFLRIARELQLNCDKDIHNLRIIPDIHSFAKIHTSFTPA